MVDKENQWEDMEYSEGQDSTMSYEQGNLHDSNEEYADTNDNQEYDSYEEYEDEDDEEDEEPSQKRNNPIPMLIIFILLLGAGAFIAVPKFMGGMHQSSNNEQKYDQTIDINALPQQTNSEDLANSFFNEASGENPDMMSVNFGENGEAKVTTGEGENAQVATVTDASSTDGVSETDLFENQNGSNLSTGEENNSIMVVYNKASRVNPFKPPVIDKSMDQAYETINDTQFEIIEPPVTSVPDENLTRLLQTQISGILYDAESPSAIINLNGLDQFVKAGDTISGYKIESITRDKVQISYKNNSYVASVGELFTRGSLEKQPAVANLENKFAGRYKNKE